MSDSKYVGSSSDSSTYSATDPDNGEVSDSTEIETSSTSASDLMEDGLTDEQRDNLGAFFSAEGLESFVSSLQKSGLMNDADILVMLQDMSNALQDMELTLDSIDLDDFDFESLFDEESLEDFADEDEVQSADLQSELQKALEAAQATIQALR